MKHALYIIGEPGVGKTTLMTELKANKLWEPHGQPFLHQHSGLGVAANDPLAVELGGPREGFGGTDVLGMAVQPQAVAFLAGPCAPQLLLGEGDRLGNGKWFASVSEAGYQLYVYHLHGPRLAERRRAERSARLGTEPQHPTWVKGRRTKVESLSLAVGATVLDASLPVNILVLSMMDPVSRVLRGEVEPSHV